MIFLLINENELSQCLLFGLNEFLKNDNLEIKELKVEIKDQLLIKAKAYYNQQLITISASCILDYYNQELVIREIEGIIEYLFFKFSIISLLKQHFKDLKIINNNLYIPCLLQIESIEYKDGYVDIKIA